MTRRRVIVGAVTFPVALRFAPGALAGGTPVALVTADTQSRVAVVELSTGKILRSIQTVAGPRSIESVWGKVAVVCHTAQGIVSLIDGASLRVRRVVGRFGEPRYTAAGANARHAFVTDSGAPEVVTVDVLTGRTVARVNVGGPARHVSIAPGYRILWGSLGSKAEEVAVVDVSRPLAPRLLRRFRPPFLAHDVGMAPRGRHVWGCSGRPWRARGLRPADRRSPAPAAGGCATAARDLLRLARVRDERGGRDAARAVLAEWPGRAHDEGARGPPQR